MKKAFLLPLFMILLVFAGCNNSQKSSTDSAENSGATIVLTNHDQEITYPVAPQRVVVMDVGALDVLDDLGIGNRVVAIGKQGIPNYLKKYEEDKDVINIGGLMEPNFEKIHGAKPDLIIIGMRQLKDYDQYVEIAPTYVYELDYTELVTSITTNVIELGQIFEMEEKAESRLDQMMENIDREKQKISENDAKAMLVMFNNGKFSAYGHNSRFGYIFDDFEVIPSTEEIQTSTHGASVSSEYILDRNPEILFVIDRNAAISDEKIQKESIENALIKQTKAYKNSKIIYLDPQTWYIAGGGLQSMEKAAQEVGAAY